MPKCGLWQGGPTALPIMTTERYGRGSLVIQGYQRSCQWPRDLVAINVAVTPDAVSGETKVDWRFEIVITHYVNRVPPNASQLNSKVGRTTAKQGDGMPNGDHSEPKETGGFVEIQHSHQNDSIKL
jgi:hypothetical protein